MRSPLRNFVIMIFKNELISYITTSITELNFLSNELDLNFRFAGFGIFACFKFLASESSYEQVIVIHGSPDDKVISRHHENVGLIIH